VSGILGLPLLAAILAGIAVAIFTTILVRPRTRLSGRFRPYTVVPRSMLGRSVELGAVHANKDQSTFVRLFGPPLFSVANRFGRLIDSTGEKLPFEVGYQVYSTFFYYHAYTEYAEPIPDGKGVQQLKRIGDKIVHAAAFQETVIPGSLAGKGSFWKNGEVTLEFKDLGEVDGNACAILGLDWGECTWSMPMTIMRPMRLKTTGVSTCRGDIYLDLEARWVRKLVTTLSEETVTTMWGVAVDRSKPVTTLTITAVSKEEFDQG